MKADIQEFIEEHAPEEEILLADGFDEALLGLGQRFNQHMAVYDRDKCIRSGVRLNVFYHLIK